MNNNVLIPAVKTIVAEAMEAKLNSTNTLDFHIGIAFDDFRTKWENKLSSRDANAIHEQLLSLGFMW